MYADILSRHVAHGIVAVHTVEHDYFEAHEEEYAAMYYNVTLALSCFRDSKFKVIVERKEYDLSGSFILVRRPGDFSQFKMEKDYKNWCMLSMHNGVASKLSERYKAIAARLEEVAKTTPLVKISDEDARVFCEKLNGAYERIKRKDYPDANELAGYEELAIEIIKRSEPCEGKPYEFDAEKVGDVIGYIEANFKNELSVSIIADKFYRDKFHLCRIFKKYTGYTIEQFITIKRLMNSYKLLFQGVGVEDAGRQSGFKNVQVFIKAFKSMFGETPKQYVLSEMKRWQQ